MSLLDFTLVSRAVALAALPFVTLAIGCEAPAPLLRTTAQAIALPVFAAAGDGTFQSTTLPYTVDEEFTANTCEFYVNAFGRGAFAKASAYRRWYEAWVSVDAASLVASQDGTILNVGMFAAWHGLNSDSPDGAALLLGREVEPAYYALRMNYDENLHGASFTAVRREVTQLAFFLDVKRASGSVVRLWLTDGWQDFTPAGIFDGYPTHFLSLGLGGVSYILGDSPIYDQKRNCQ